jgi:hypothetical protein
MIGNGIFKVKLTEDRNMQSCLESAKTKFINIAPSGLEIKYTVLYHESHSIASKK